MKTKLWAAALVLLTIWGLKRYYADARVDDLRWILSPTTRIVEAVTGAAFVFERGEGYLSRDRLFLIEKSCAGINFMIAAFGMSAFVLCRRAGSMAACAAAIGESVLVSYAAAVVVNAVRIAVALWLVAHPIAATGLTAAEVHRLEGIVVYFGGLVLLCALLQQQGGVVSAFRLTGMTFRWVAVPLGWYYAITLALPLANGAAHVGARFAEHAVIVIAVPLTLIALGYSACGLARFVCSCRPAARGNQPL